VSLFVFARHAQSVLNFEQRVNGDPSRPGPLTELGRAEAHLLGLELTGVPLDVCVHTRFVRTRETAELAVGDRAPLVVEPLLDDIDVGELEGLPVAEYRAWKKQHTRADPFPSGESLDDAARRYGRAFRQLLDARYERALVVCHEIPIRYALNAASGSKDLDGPAHDIPNARPFLFDEEALARAVAGLDAICGREDSNLQGLSPDGS
jgi:broad specificity phosphatase PhoE